MPGVWDKRGTVASELSRLLSGFRGRKLVVVGDLVADNYVYGQTDRVSREAPVLVVRHESSEVTLGGAANAAANARALGAEVTAVGVLGRDEMGEAVRQDSPSAASGWWPSTRRSPRPRRASSRAG